MCHLNRASCPASRGCCLHATHDFAGQDSEDGFLDPSIRLRKAPMGFSTEGQAMEEQMQQSANCFIQSFLDGASDDTEKPFRCGICLDLVYKPIVQSCGHIFCFWCAHRSMNVMRESHCPACRRPYIFFPRVCKMLHFMLIKALPDEYEERGNEIRNMEERKQVFSPHFQDYLYWSPRKGDRVQPTTHVWPHAEQAQAEATPLLQTNGRTPRQTDTENILSKDDFFCSSCNRLLYRPVVLNCGEVFCESCLANVIASENCPTCGDRHHGGFTSVCLELHHLLEKVFPEDYVQRGKEQQSEQLFKKRRQTSPCALEEPSTCVAEVSLHVGVGCDGCGMFPIIGERFRCQGCTEKIGFDLCGTCYRLGGSLSGRFNQQHKPDHQMVKVVGKAVPQQQMVLDMRNGTIIRRRQPQPQQISPNDLDDYIDSFV